MLDETLKFSIIGVDQVFFNFAINTTSLSCFVFQLCYYCDISLYYTMVVKWCWRGYMLCICRHGLCGAGGAGLWNRTHCSPVASFTKEVYQWLAKCPLVSNGHLANRWLTSLVKEATGNQNYTVVWLICLSICSSSDCILHCSFNEAR